MQRARQNTDRIIEKAVVLLGMNRKIVANGDLSILENRKLLEDVGVI